MRTLKCGIYARVSTKKQETDLQLTDLRKYVERMGWQAIEYVEKASSVKQRPVFERLLKDAKAGRIDVVLVWRIDRFARSMRDFVNITLQLKSWKVRLISATENVESGDENPFAKFMLGLLAELERNIIVERVKAGVAEARRQGKHCGRPALVWDRDQAQQLRQQGWSWRQIASELGVPQSSVRLALDGVQKGIGFCTLRQRLKAESSQVYRPKKTRVTLPLDSDLLARPKASAKPDVY
jgi:DNA invertase Pin-like site-specific DNA recombinase